jgi:hypothetical protein
VRTGRCRVAALTRIARLLHVRTGRRVHVLELRTVVLVDRADLGTLSFGQIEGISHAAEHLSAFLVMIAPLVPLTTLSFGGAGRDRQEGRNCTDSEDLHSTNLQL